MPSTKAVSLAGTGFLSLSSNLLMPPASIVQFSVMNNCDEEFVLKVPYKYEAIQASACNVNIPSLVLNQQDASSFDFQLTNALI